MFFFFCNYAAQDVIGVLKSAREAKGLSQRALSNRTGVPQSHISKIESGGTDIRLSSLIELTRALDLDLKLVPRKAVPAVDSIVSSIAPKIDATPAIKEINRTLDALRNLRPLYPELEALNNLQSSLQTFKTLSNVGKELEALRSVTKPVRELQKLTERSRKLTEAFKLSNEQFRALERAACSAQTLCSRLVHAVSEQPSLPRPAYRLDDDGENGDD